MASFDIDKVLAKLSLDDKIKLLSGKDFWHTEPFPEHGVPSIRVSDGPNGVRGTKTFNGLPAACFPCGTALGSTWNEPLLREAGKLMGAEAKVKGAAVILGPCINMQRSPLGGRGFESISEDPVLAGVGAAALTNGIQSTGILATIKHFVTNDQEHERTGVDSLVTERALREIYLRPFQIAVRDSNPRAFMTGYNKLNGTHISENELILGDVLRGEWGWKGLVMSDWFGTYSTDRATIAGLDLEMPGPTRWRGGLLSHLVNAHRVPPQIIDERARTILSFVDEAAKSGVKENQTEGTLDTPETAAMLRKLACESIVLCKNEGGVLPLSKDKSTLVIGPNSKSALYCGGGSSSMVPYYAVSPFDGIAAKISDPKNLQHRVGCYSHKELPLITLQEITISEDPKSKRGLSFKAYNDPPSADHSRTAVDTIECDSSLIMLMDYYCAKIESKLFYVDVEGYYHAERTGDYELGLCIYGTGKLFVNDELVIDNETKQTLGTVFYGNGTVEEKGKFHMEKGRTYHIKVEFASAVTSKTPLDGGVGFGGGAMRIGGAWALDMSDTIAEAAALAKEVDQVVIAIGLGGDWEGEGSDRADMRLPGRTDDLVRAIIAANPRAVVVNQTGTPVELPWLEQVAGFVQAWYGGNETGNAIADVLFGDFNPSGRSSLSWPKRVQHNPCYYNFRSEGGRVLYGEDVYVGYRHYDTVEREVNFGFGSGLSYTTFELSDLKVSKTEGPELHADLKLSVSVKNTGDRDGQNVVQVYVHQHQPKIRRPPRELKGFSKVNVRAGASETASIEIALKDAASYWDEIRKAWIVESGKYDVQVIDGRGEQPLLVQTIEVADTFWWNGL